MKDKTLRQGNSFILLDVSHIWCKVSSYAIHEDVKLYLENLDKMIDEAGDVDTIFLTGKSPIWLYLIVVARIIQKKPNCTITYSKPTSKGNRAYKIYPF